MLARVEERLRRVPSAFGFFQAVRLLERLRPRRTPVGGFGDPRKEAVAFSASTSLAFAPAAIQELELPQNADAPARLVVNFLGLSGPEGALPHAYTELAAGHARQRDTALRDFLDLFHHRVLSLFYRAWRKYRFDVAAESQGEDRLAAHVLDLCGVGLENVRRSLTVSEPAVVFHAGLLARQPPSALALEQVLSHYFAVPVQVDQFAGSWSPVRAGELTSLDDDAASPSNALGDGALVGDEVWDPQGGLRLRIGPLSREQFDAFLPGGSGHEPLRSLTRLATRGQFDVEAQLVLSREAVPALVLGGGDEEPGRLGWTTWLRSRPLELNPDDTTFCL